MRISIKCSEIPFQDEQIIISLLNVPKHLDGVMHFYYMIVPTKNIDVKKHPILKNIWILRPLKPGK